MLWWWKCYISDFLQWNLKRSGQTAVKYYTREKAYFMSVVWCREGILSHFKSLFETKTLDHELYLKQSMRELLLYETFYFFWDCRRSNISAKISFNNRSNPTVWCRMMICRKKCTHTPKNLISNVQFSFNNKLRSYIVCKSKAFFSEKCFHTVIKL